MEEARAVVERLVAGRRGRLRDHDRLRRPGDDVHPAGRRAAAPGEPARQPRRGRRARRCRGTWSGRCSSCGRTRWRSATRAAGRCSWTGCCGFLELGIHPVVPAQGSVGASGDLAPLAHLALPLIGRGEVELGGHVMPALLALREEGLDPLVLEAKEGLALLNGTQLMSAIGALLLADADRLARTASVAAAQIGRGAAGHGRRLCRRLPAGPAAPRPGRRRRGDAPPPARLRADGPPPRLVPQGPGPVLAALRARRSTAPSGTRSTTCGACSTSR